MKQIDLRRLLGIAGLLSLAIIYPILWLKMISSPSERAGTDFIAFFAAGRVAQAHGLACVYDPALQQAVEEQVAGFPLAPGQVLLYNHVPFLVPLVMIVVNEGYTTSFIRWVLMLMVVFIAGIALLLSLLRSEGWGKRQQWLPLGGMLLFFLFFISLMNGQDSAFTTLGLCLWFFGLLTGRDWLAGLGLALVTVRPHLALMLAVPFLFRQRKVLIWFVIGSVILGIASLLMLGWQGAGEFWNSLVVSAGGTAYGMKESAMVNLVGYLTRLFPNMDAQVIHWMGWGGYALGIGFLCFVWARSKVLNEYHFSLAVIFTLFLAPHLHYHDLALLLVPVTGCMLGVVRQGWFDQRTSGLLPLVISLFLLLGSSLLGSLAPGVKYDLPVVVMVVLVIILRDLAKGKQWRSGTHEIIP